MDLSHDGLVPYVAGMHACVQTQYDAIHVSAQAQLVIVLIVQIGCEKIPGISISMRGSSKFITRIRNRSAGLSHLSSNFPLSLRA